MKFKNILNPKGQVYFLNKIDNYYWIIVAAEMIAETSGSCTAVFTGDSTFLYSVVEWTRV